MIKNKRGQSIKLLVFVIIMFITLVGIVHYTSESIISDYTLEGGTLEISNWELLGDLLTFQVASDFWLVGIIMWVYAALILIALIGLLRGV